MRAHTLVGLVAFVPLSTLVAQGTRTLRDDAIPRDLVEALLAGPGNPRMPTIVVGQLPTALTGKVYLPPQARVLGGTTSANQSTVVFVSPMRPQAVRDDILREQAKLGWTVIGQPIMTTMMLRRGGFADAPDVAGVNLADSPTVPMSFCSGNTTLSVTIDPQNLIESRVTERSYADAGNCAMIAQQVGVMSASSPIMRDPMLSMRWPVLINPAGAHSTYGSCTQMSYGGGGSDTQLTTSLGAEELFTHYGKQLADSGWKPTGDAVVGRGWERRDSTGKQQEIIITIKSDRFGSNCHDLRMESRMSRSP